MNYETQLRIAADHPALPGHFPGQPIAPGVVLLDAVLTHAERWLGRPLSIAALPQVKFTAALAPGQKAHLRLSLNGDDLKFSIVRDDAPIAQGTFRLHAGTTHDA
jgi:3-hydroxymyristoyl/3-hydroxydecanoyl-(acyl carrier protein) dehydratase